MSQEKPARALRRDEMRKFKNLCVVFGSRKYKDKQNFKDCLEGFIRDYNLTRENCVFVSGMAPSGPDALIVEWCKEVNWNWHECPANWDDITAPGARIKLNRFGKEYNALAGFTRNEEMASICGLGLGFWDFQSPGTDDMVKRCGAKEMKLRLIRVQV